MHVGPPIAMNAMPDSDNAPEWLDVEMHELARPRPLIAGDGRGRLECRQFVETETRQNRRHRRTWYLDPHRNGPSRQPLMAGGNDPRDDLRRGAPRLSCWHGRAILKS